MKVKDIHVLTVTTKQLAHKIWKFTLKLSTKALNFNAHIVIFKLQEKIICRNTYLQHIQMCHNIKFRIKLELKNFMAHILLKKTVKIR